MHTGRTKGAGDFWQFRVNGTADIFVIFAESRKGKKLKDYELLIFPQSFVNTNVCKSIFKGSELHKGFRIEPTELVKFLDMYDDVRDYI